MSEGAADLFSVAGKVVVVTGGLGQLGRQFALALADRGARVAVFDARVNDPAVAERFGDRYRDGSLLFVPVDVYMTGSNLIVDGGWTAW